MNEELVSEFNEWFNKYLYERERNVRFILKNKIDKPIKGEVTKGKLRWRGIKSLAVGPNDELIGVIQRDKVIGVDGFIATLDDNESLAKFIKLNNANSNE